MPTVTSGQGGEDDIPRAILRGRTCPFCLYVLDSDEAYTPIRFPTHIQRAHVACAEVASALPKIPLPSDG